MNRIHTKRLNAAIYTGCCIQAVLGVFAIYFGLYFLLLERKVYVATGTDPVTGQNLFDIEPRYRIDSAVMTTMLVSAHRWDRRLRSEYWATVEHSSGRTWKNPSP